jgi:hypothetical protein
MFRRNKTGSWLPLFPLWRVVDCVFFSVFTWWVGWLERRRRVGVTSWTRGILLLSNRMVVANRPLPWLFHLVPFGRRPALRIREAPRSRAGVGDRRFGSSDGLSLGPVTLDSTASGEVLVTVCYATLDTLCFPHFVILFFANAK